ncbi:MAG TPA: hypothetical protein VIY51_21860 [Xanthobacteraceae bacterium]
MTNTGDPMPSYPISDDGYPDDWFVPPSANTPTAAPPAFRAQPDPFNSGFANSPAQLFDPFAPHWDSLPADSLRAFAWAPPIFPDAFGRFSLRPPAPTPPSFPPIPADGLLAGIPKILAARAAADAPADPVANGLLGGIAKMLSAPAAPQGLFGSLVNWPTSGDPSISAAGSPFGFTTALQPATSNAHANVSYAAAPQAFESPDLIGYQGGNPLYTYLRNNLSHSDPSALAQDQLRTGETPDVVLDAGAENAGSNAVLVGGEEEPHKKIDPVDPLDPLDPLLGAGPGPIGPAKALPTLPVIPFFPRPALPPSAPQSSHGL